MAEAVVDEDFVPYDPVEQFKDVAGDVRDPWPVLAELREQAPVQAINIAKAMGMPIDPKAPTAGMQIVSVLSHEHVTEVLKDTERFNSSGYAMVVGQLMGHTILEMDAPEHPRHRALVAHAFRPRILEKWSDTLIAAAVDELLDPVIEQGRGDLVRILTFPFPVKVISRILGLPDRDWPRFQRWSIELISMAANWDRAVAASTSLRDYFANVIEERRANPQDDLISQLVQAEVDGHVLNDEEIFSFLRLLLPAGAETTYRSLGNLLYGLLTHTDQLEAVRENRSLLPQAIEEGIRWEPPLLFIQRLTSKDTSLAGIDLPANQIIAVCIGAANRDPKRYPDPDAFDIFREPQQTVSFGAGPHLCLGTHLAKAESKIAMNALLDRMPNLRLDPEGLKRDPHVHGLAFRAPTELPVLWDA